ncbi:hypothetical protein, partial [Treponema endosymbiont of Eucomonympha sp.]|uniref:hypothetical protein n=1 Tax=Treponema endosymbiont of Eucomonympha sp. TaxID=1580831 RepID=UPI001E5C58D4
STASAAISCRCSRYTLAALPDSVQLHDENYHTGVAGLKKAHADACGARGGTQDISRTKGG